ncbi:MAG: tetratricopeptide repeat protein [Luteolibacter sp.]
MKLWPFVFTLLALQSPLSLGQTTPSPSTAGDDALASGLWELAISRYKEQLAKPGLKTEEKSALTLKLAEAWLRFDRPKDALALLTTPAMEKNPDSRFWKAQALARLDRTDEAIAMFKTLCEEQENRFFTEASLSLANLLISKNQQTEAFFVMDRLIHESAGEARLDARLRKVEILLDSGRNEEARAAFPQANEIPENDRPLADFLEAQLLLAEQKPADAAAKFSALLQEPQGQSLIHYHSAALGLADALQARQNTDDAIQSLLDFLRNHPDTPLIESVFDRLIQWMPETPETSDPLLLQLAQWSNTGVSPTDSDLVSSRGWPTDQTPNLLAAYAAFTRAVALHRIGTPVGKNEARILLNRLRLEPLPGFFKNRVLLQQGRWLLDEGKFNQASLILDALRGSKDGSSVIGEAAFLEASAAFTMGDSKKASQLFEEAAASLHGASSQISRVNARLAMLKGNTLPSDGTTKDQLLQTELQLERALSEPDPAKARKLTDAFLSEHPDHPRVPEARLWGAECALSTAPPDLSYAAAQLDIITALPGIRESLPAASLVHAQLRLADLSKNPAVTMPLARAVMEQYADQPIASEAAFILGRNLFETGNFNDARLVLERLATTDTDASRAQACWLIAARSAALGGTPKSREEALILFDKAISQNGPLTPIAVLEKARLMIDVVDLNKLPEAIKFLGKWFNTLKQDDPLRLPAGFLLSEAYYAQGSSDPKSLEEALSIYNQLLVHAKDQPALLYRLQYLRGMALEHMPMPENPKQMRTAEAFAAYYSVLESATPSRPPAEWDYFERCGFSAFLILKNEKRWKAAIDVAEKIASFKGPKAAEAEAAAQAIRLKYMIWED